MYETLLMWIFPSYLYNSPFHPSEWNVAAFNEYECHIRRTLFRHFGVV